MGKYGILGGNYEIMKSKYCILIITDRETNITFYSCMGTVCHMTYYGDIYFINATSVSL